MRRSLLLSIVVVGLTLAAVQAGAQEGPAPNQPPIVVEEAQEAQEAAPWTTRYLVPTLMVLGAVLVLVMIVSYYWRLKTRYRVVE